MEEKIKGGVKKWWTGIKESDLKVKKRQEARKEWIKLDAVERAQYGNFKNFYEGNRVAQKAKGGVIRQPVAQNRKLAKGGAVKKSRTRKKSIDGIARRGHTRAPHK